MSVHKKILTCNTCEKLFRSVKAMQNHCKGGCPKERENAEKDDESGGDECAAGETHIEG